MRTHMSFGRKVRRPVGVLAAGVLVALGACSSILDVKNPNDVSESALDDPAGANAMSNGVVAATSRMLSALTVPYAVATDELDWIGSRDAWFDLETGGLGNYVNEFTDGAFPYVGEARFMGDNSIAKIEGFLASGALTDQSILARTYLYTAVTYTTVADMYDDFAFSEKTVSKAPIGRAAMNTLYDKAVSYLDKALALAGNSNTMKYNLTAYRARVKHAKGVWSKITPKGATASAAPLVSDAGANTDAAAAILLGTTDQKFTLDNNVEANAGINIWFEVNGRNESALGVVYKNLVDPVSGVADPGIAARLAAFTAFGTQEGTFTLTSTRELRLILAEAALQAANIAEFTNQINQVRALDGKPNWAGVPAAQAMLVYERQSQLWLMNRRLSDMYRFNIKEAKWTNNPNFESAFSVNGLLFPIPNVERLSNACIANPATAGC